MKYFIVVLTICILSNTLLSQGMTEIPYTNYTDIKMDGKNALGKIAIINLRYESQWKPDKWHEDSMMFKTVDAKTVYLKKKLKFNSIINKMVNTNIFRNFKFRIIETGNIIVGEIISIE